MRLKCSVDGIVVDMYPVISTFEVSESTHSPGGAPTVLNNPVFFSVLFTPSHKCDDVVDVSVSGEVSHDTRSVESEVVWASVDRDRKWAMFEHSSHQCLVIGLFWEGIEASDLVSWEVEISVNAVFDLENSRQVSPHC